MAAPEIRTPGSPARPNRDTISWVMVPPALSPVTTTRLRSAWALSHGSSPAPSESGTEIQSYTQNIYTRIYKHIQRRELDRDNGDKAEVFSRR